MREPVEGGFRGGCRARALTFAGSVDAPDPWFEQYSRGDAGCGLTPHHPGANVESETPGTFALPLVPRVEGA